jgi:hypothetical protein
MKAKDLSADVADKPYKLVILSYLRNLRITSALLPAILAQSRSVTHPICSVKSEFTWRDCGIPKRAAH